MYSIIYFLKKNFQISGFQLGAGDAVESQGVVLEAPLESGREGLLVWELGAGPDMKNTHSMNLGFHSV